MKFLGFQFTKSPKIFSVNLVKVYQSKKKIGTDIMDKTKKKVVNIRPFQVS